MSERIGIVTGGGDCPGLNAVIRAAAKAGAKRGWEAIGFLGGYEGILEPQRYVQLAFPWWACPRPSTTTWKAP